MQHAPNTTTLYPISFAQSWNVKCDNMNVQLLLVWRWDGVGDVGGVLFCIWVVGFCIFKKLLNKCLAICLHWSPVCHHSIEGQVSELLDILSCNSPWTFSHERLHSPANLGLCLCLVWTSVGRFLTLMKKRWFWFQFWLVKTESEVGLILELEPGSLVFQRIRTKLELGSWFFRNWNWIQVLQNPPPTFTPVLVLVLKIELGSSPILCNLNLTAG